jgi:hypothetical protein
LATGSAARRMMDILEEKSGKVKKGKGMQEFPRTRYSKLSKRDQNTVRCRKSAIPAGETNVAPPIPQGKMTLANRGNETL